MAGLETAPGRLGRRSPHRTVGGAVSGWGVGGCLEVFGCRVQGSGGLGLVKRDWGGGPADAGLAAWDSIPAFLTRLFAAPED